MTAQADPVGVELQPLPATACWRHEGLRSGFEVAYFRPEPAGLNIEGTTAGYQDGLTWVVSYHLTIDHRWRTRDAWITTRTASGAVDRHIEADGRGHWRVDGQRADRLNGCLDLDLESSAMTNTLPVHRLALAEGQQAAAPAAYVRLPDAHVDLLEQSYARLENPGAGRRRYDYRAPAFDFRADLVYDDTGLVLDYPGIAVRVG
jgi:hypothetical protein